MQTFLQSESGWKKKISVYRNARRFKQQGGLSGTEAVLELKGHGSLTPTAQLISTTIMAQHKQMDRLNIPIKVLWSTIIILTILFYHK